ncbi:MAG TPA: glycosyltransferase family 39 protein [Anaerolineae bacterium]|nr:glycosyltransferase family 39 protein [Anaerolineae bacterium]
MKVFVNNYGLKIVFVLAISLRVVLGLINSEANDDHLPVVHLIMEENRLPLRDECWECFQPKLYHAAIAGIFELFSIESLGVQIRVAQMVNVIAGSLLLVPVYYFLADFIKSRASQLLIFSLIAFNPRLIAVSIQATNDMLAIFFSTLVIYFTYRYLQTDETKIFAYVILFSTLATLTKGSGLIVFIAVFLILGLNLINQKLQLKYLGYVTMAVLGLGMSLYGGQYIQNYCTYGTPLVTNSPKKPFPNFSQPTFEGRPGVVSIKSAYFTFRVLALISEPQMSYENNEAPWHQTSLWTQLYGRLNSIQFDPWPRSWVSDNGIRTILAQMTFFFALVPTSLMVFGIFVQLKELGVRVRRSFASLFVERIWMIQIFGLGYIAFILLYTLQYRDVATMKVIFILPGLICFLYLLISGYQQVEAMLNGSRVMTFIQTSILLVVCLYIGEVVLFAVDLPIYSVSPYVNSWTVSPLSPLEQTPMFCGS